MYCMNRESLISDILLQVGSGWLGVGKTIYRPKHTKFIELAMYTAYYSVWTNSVLRFCI